MALGEDAIFDAGRNQMNAVKLAVDFSNLTVIY